MGYGPAAGAKGGRAYVRRAVEASLRRLRTDHIDLYQLHTPDPVTPIAETLAALDELVVEGKVRYIGHSNFSGWQLAEAAHVARRARRHAVRVRAEPLVAARARRSSASWCRRPSTTASASSPTSRSPAGCSPARSAAATRSRRAPGSHGRAAPRHRRAPRPGRRTDQAGRAARPLLARPGHRRARRAPRDGLGDRGRDQARAGLGERQSRILGAHCRRAGRDRRGSSSSLPLSVARACART